MGPFRPRAGVQQRALHTMSTFVESKESLKEMQLMTFKMLAAATA